MALYHCIHRICMRSSLLGLLIPCAVVGIHTLSFSTSFFTGVFTSEHNFVYIVKEEVLENLKCLLALFK